MRISNDRLIDDTKGIMKKFTLETVNRSGPQNRLEALPRLEDALEEGAVEDPYGEPPRVRSGVDI